MKTRLFLFPVMFLLAACGTSREYAYISDAERDSAQAIISTFASTIHPGDQLYIYVASQTPESVIPFNEETNKAAAGMTGIVAVSQPMKGNGTDGYLVSQNGTIAFPVLGTLPAAGMTRDSLAHDIEERLRDGGYVNDPIVTISLMNFRVAVIGEVKNPQELHITGERLTIFEALAMCGDVTIHGLRNNVAVIRQASSEGSQLSTINPQVPNNTGEVGIIDLTSKDIFNSPYYYLQQGDIVYVEPDAYQKRLASRDPNIPSYATLTVASAQLLVNLYRIIILDPVRNPQRY